MSQLNAASKPNVYCDGSLNRTVAPPSESNEPAWLLKGLARFDVATNPCHAAVCAALAFCLPNRSTAQLLSLPNDLLLNVATHLHLEPHGVLSPSSPAATCSGHPGGCCFSKRASSTNWRSSGETGSQRAPPAALCPATTSSPTSSPKTLCFATWRGVWPSPSDLSCPTWSIRLMASRTRRSSANGGVLRGGPLALDTCGPCSAHTTRCRFLCHAVPHARKALSQPLPMRRVPLCRHGAPMSSFDWTEEASGLPRLAAVRRPPTPTLSWPRLGPVVVAATYELLPARTTRSAWTSSGTSPSICTSAPRTSSSHL